MASKAAFVLLACALMFSLALTACGNGGNKGGNGGQSDGNKSKVVVWYLWGGAEGEVMEEIIQDFNSSQDKYVAEGLSVPDEQKVKVAIAGGNGPDVTDSFDWSVPQYAQQGIALSLEELIARDQYDLADFIPAAMEAVKYDGKVYALPLNVSFSLMYYNKKLLADAGFTEPPKTASELLEVARKTTKLNADKSIDVLGFPSYPSEGHAFSAMAYGFGSTYLNADATELTMNNESTMAAMKLITDYNTEFGVDNIRQVQASGKWLDPTDPFLTGKQAIRFDGPWLSAHIKKKQIDIDYGIAPLPYLDSKPESAGGGVNSSSIFYIAKTAKNVDGAWAFMKYLYSPPALAKFLVKLGNIPATKAAMDEPAMQELADGKQIIELSKSPNLKSIPNFVKRNDFDKAMNEELELMFNLKRSPEETMKALEERLTPMLK